jgi:hypothetical protein
MSNQESSRFVLSEPIGELLSVKYVAEELSVSEGRVYQLIREYGIKTEIINDRIHIYRSNFNDLARRPMRGRPKKVGKKATRRSLGLKKDFETYCEFMILADKLVPGPLSTETYKLILKDFIAFLEQKVTNLDRMTTS